jgi:glutamate/tyrosine decarboxylase-like PLP-dependent enzyme
MDKSLKKYFQDPKNDSINELQKQISSLDGAVKKISNVKLARIPGLTGKYESYLEKSKIPQTEQDPDRVLKDFARYFKGAVRWHHPWTMINITPPPLIPSVAATAVTMLYNPNLAIDVSCGGLGLTELEVIKHISDLVGWDWRKSFGVFTFGGKGTDLYGAKVALRRNLPETMDKGVRGKVAISSTAQCHPCHVEICDWLGIGKENCFRLDTDSSGRVDLEKAEKTISSYLSKGGKLVCIMLSGASTLNYAVDPILKVVRMRDRLVKKYKLSYKPHVHVDAVLGWVWLFFKNYDFDSNPLGIDQKSLAKLKKMYRAVAQLKYDDSFGVDFHKTGFCPYLSSLFMVRKKEWIDNLGTSKQPTISELEFGNSAPFTYTLESSRPANGSVSALIALKVLGYQGFQKLISDLVSVAEKARREFNLIPGFKTVNPEAMGFATLFMVLPPEIDLSYKKILEENEKKASRIAEYNYKFYLFLLEKQTSEGSPIALDYVSGYETNRVGIKIGVMKMYVVSPFCTHEQMDRLLKELKKYKKQFDQVEDHFVPKACPYRPKPLVLR